MKQCVSIIDEEYDGELRFSIIESVLENDSCAITIGAKDGEELVGMKVIIPVLTRRMLFKPLRLIPPASTLKLESIGEKSDRLVATMAKYFQPDYEPSDGFTRDEVNIDFTVRNQGMYDLENDKIYLRLRYDEEQDEGIPDSERIHLDMNFSFNLNRESASLIETKEGYSADLISFIMK